CMALLQSFYPRQIPGNVGNFSQTLLVTGKSGISRNTLEKQEKTEGTRCKIVLNEREKEGEMEGKEGVKKVNYPPSSPVSEDLTPPESPVSFTSSPFYRLPINPPHRENHTNAASKEQRLSLVVFSDHFIK
ncbi:hypothetical protein NQZ68_015717, partial [Dissostichus eleginoides]